MKTCFAFACLAIAFTTPLSAAAPGKTYAQYLVDQTITRHPEVAVLAMHVTPPKSADNIIIASNIGRIGKKADEDDLRVIRTGQPNLAVNKTGDRFEVELVLQDTSQRPIGALGTVFTYKQGDDKLALQKKAEQIRNELRRRISHVANLMEPAQFDATLPTDTYAQALVDEAFNSHPNIIILALHVTPPGRSKNVILGSTIGRIGKEADEDDLNVIKTGEPKLEINETGDRFEVELPLLDKAGSTIGALGVVFPYKKGDDQAPHKKEAEQLRDALKEKISNVEALMRRVKPTASANRS